MSVLFNSSAGSTDEAYATCPGCKQGVRKVYNDPVLKTTVVLERHFRTDQRTPCDGSGLLISKQQR